MLTKQPIDQRLIDEAQMILRQIGLPARHINERTAICLLAVVDVKQVDNWATATPRLIGIRQILDFARANTNRNYAENTRETVRDESIKPMVAAGILALNPDEPGRKVNSSKTAYRVTDEALLVIQSFGTRMWDDLLEKFLTAKPSLVERYARARQMERVPLVIKEKFTVSLSPGEHSRLTRAILDDFCERFTPGGEVVYVGDTEAKWGAYFDRDLAKSINIAPKAHGQMPDVVVYLRARHWLVLVEAVISNGPVDDRRREELTALFASSGIPLVFVTAFASRGVMRKYLADLAWETEVWCADAPTHLIHFNGDKFLGPH
jgi:hypothetical protein